MRAPGPGSMWRLRLLDRKRIPAVLLFWVMVANLPPPVPKKTRSTLFMVFTGGERTVYWLRLWWRIVIKAFESEGG